MKSNSAFMVALKLFLITAVAALCLALANMATEGVIEANNLKAELQTKKEVLSQASEFKKLNFAESDISQAASNGVRVEEFNIGLEKDRCVGYVVTVVSPNGYGGDVKVMVGLDAELNILKTVIVSAAETPGLGGNASKPKFIDQFKGKSGKLKVVKGEATKDDEISAISSATITSKAVTESVNAATELLENKLAAGFSPTTTVETDEKQKEIEEKTKEQMEKNPETGGAA